MNNFKRVGLFLFSFCFSTIYAQEHKSVDVLTLGIFHFEFPNLDTRKTNSDKQIDVLDDVYQKELIALIDNLAKFKPTKIVIEVDYELQPKIDSLYQAYLKGEHQLSRFEGEQIGFRLAKKLGLHRVYCVNNWGKHYQEVADVIFQRDTIGYNHFLEFFENNPDKNKKFFVSDEYRKNGIINSLVLLNNEENIQNSLGNYLISAFKFEHQPNDFMGVEFETGRWFDRNLKIFRNIQRIIEHSEDRVLVIFGADHMNLLNVFFDASPEFNRLKTQIYLQ